jgi:hypothetical protein
VNWFGDQTGGIIGDGGTLAEDVVVKIVLMIGAVLVRGHASY